MPDPWRYRGPRGEISAIRMGSGDIAGLPSGRWAVLESCEWSADAPEHEVVAVGVAAHKIASVAAQGEVGPDTERAVERRASEARGDAAEAVGLEPHAPVALLEILRAHELGLEDRVDGVVARPVGSEDASLAVQLV